MAGTVFPSNLLTSLIAAYINIGHDNVAEIMRNGVVSSVRESVLLFHVKLMDDADLINDTHR